MGQTSDYLTLLTAFCEEYEQRFDCDLSERRDVGVRNEWGGRGGRGLHGYAARGSRAAALCRKRAGRASAAQREHKRIFAVVMDLTDCHGNPFYAGWGLTQDTNPLSRRTRQRSLTELIAATLIIYPRYISPRTNKLISVEEAIQELMLQQLNKEKLTFLRPLFRPLLRFLAEIQGRA